MNDQSEPSRQYATTSASGENCAQCGAVIHWAADRCLKCKTAIEFPFIRQLKKDEEQQALNDHYQQAWQQVKTRGCEDRWLDYVKKIEQDSHALINLSPAGLEDFISDDKSLYHSYSKQVAADSRKLAEFQDAQDRGIVESILFPSLGKNIIYAALSLDHAGLHSYGDCNMGLAEVTMANSATLLIENSYHFCQESPGFYKKNIAKGYRAIWSQRHLLAGFKVAKAIDKQSNFAQLLLECEGDRQTDQFIEVHIYGEFDNQAIESVGLPQDPEHRDAVVISRINDTANHRGIKVVWL